ncbi:MAG: hypothetical protein ACXVYM_04435 [Gaiellaceae bacterium]
MSGIRNGSGPPADTADLHLRILIERLVREGRSGREIEMILRQAARSRPQAAA